MEWSQSLRYQVTPSDKTVLSLMSNDIMKSQSLRYQVTPSDIKTREEKIDELKGRNPFVIRSLLRIFGNGKKGGNKIMSRNPFVIRSLLRIGYY